MNKNNTSASDLRVKVDVRMWKDSFFTLLVAIHRSGVAIDAHDTEMVARHVEQTGVEQTGYNPQGTEYHEKQTANNFWGIVADIERQTGLRHMVLAVLKWDEEKRAELEAKSKQTSTSEVGVGI